MREFDTAHVDCGTETKIFAIANIGKYTASKDEAVALERVEPATLDMTVVNSMLKLPKLSFEEIAELVQQNTFNHIYAIYYLPLPVDKLLAKRKEQLRLQHQTNLAYSK